MRIPKFTGLALALVLTAALLAGCGGGTPASQSSSAAPPASSAAPPPGAGSSGASTSQAPSSTPGDTLGYDIPYDEISHWLRGTAEGDLALPFSADILSYQSGTITAAQQRNIASQFNDIFAGYRSGEYPIPPGPATDFFPYAHFWPDDADLNTTAAPQDIQYYISPDSMYTLGACVEIGGGWLIIAPIVKGADETANGDWADRTPDADNYWVVSGQMQFYNPETGQYTQMAPVEGST